MFPFRCNSLSARSGRAAAIGHMGRRGARGYAGGASDMPENRPPFASLAQTARLFFCSAPDARCANGEQAKVGGEQGAGEMYRCQPDGQRGLAGQQALDDFGREGGKGGEAAEEAGDGEQFPGQREMRVQVEQANGHADQVATKQVGCQRTERQGDEQGIQRQPEQPARPGAKGGTEADGEKIQRAEEVQDGHGRILLSDSVRAGKIVRLIKEV